MKDTCGPHLQSAWASLVPKIARNGLQISKFQSSSSLSSLGIKEHAWAHIEANEQGLQGGMHDYTLLSLISVINEGLSLITL